MACTLPQIGLIGINDRANRAEPEQKMAGQEFGFVFKRRKKVT